jgi:hypothetical protein
MASSLVKAGKDLAEVLDQRVQEDGLDWSRRSMVAIPFASALGETHGNPVGRPIAGARKPLGVHKRLQQDQGMVIYPLPIPGQEASHSSQKVRGQMGNLHPGEEEEANILGQKMDMAIPVDRLPSDELIPRGHLPGGSAPAQTGQGASLVEDQILEVFPHGLTIPQVVVGLDEALVEGFPGGASHHLDIQGPQLGEGGPNGLSGVEGDGDGAPASRSASMLEGREFHQPCSLQTQEEVAAGHGFPCTVSLSPIPETTQFLGDEGAALQAMLFDNGSDKGNLLTGDPSASDAKRDLHRP